MPDPLDPALDRAVQHLLGIERDRAAAEGLVASDAALLYRGVVGNMVGAFFHNTYAPGTPDICPVCRGPALTGLCNTCSSHASSYSSELADRTVLLTYAIDNRDGSEHQSAHHMRAYKGYRSTPVSPQCSTDLQLLIATTVEIHRPCVQSWLGAEWDSFTFVPSRERPDGSHPLAKLANRVQPLDSQKRELQKFALQPGPGSGARHKHTMTEDRFHVDPRWQHHVDGKNVLIVDDTWTTGSSAQGAAIAARRAGAATVTILCVDRWLRSDWPDHRNVIDSLSGPYDVLQCPVTGQVCPAAQHFAPSRLIPH